MRSAPNVRKTVIKVNESTIETLSSSLKIGLPTNDGISRCKTVILILSTYLATTLVLGLCPLTNV
jgi:hypothetical protein